MSTGIEWTDETWNPVVGCTKVSQGCKHCYAKQLHDQRHKAHLAGKRVAPQYAEPFETVQLMPGRLDVPLRWRAPKRVFVNSVSDLFHEDVPDEYVAQVFAVMAIARRHTFQVLTKRPARMQSLLTNEDFRDLIGAFVNDMAMELTDPLDRRRDDLRATAPDVEGADWPIANVWLGVSVENQDAADERIPWLLDTPAAIRFLSCEPLLGPVNLRRIRQKIAAESFVAFSALDIHGKHQHTESRIDWVIVGGESGTEARWMLPDWPQSLRDQCVEAGVSFFFKQWGEWAPDSSDRLYRFGKKRAGRELDGRTWDEFPAVRA